jgi:hypothetical protein
MAGIKDISFKIKVISNGEILYDLEQFLFQSSSKRKFKFSRIYNTLKDTISKMIANVTDGKTRYILTAYKDYLKTACRDIDVENRSITMQELEDILKSEDHPPLNLEIGDAEKNIIVKSSIIISSKLVN